MKKFFLILLLFNLYFPLTSAEMLRPPSLMDVMKKNEEFALQKAKVNNQTFSESEKFSYYSVFQGNAIEIKKAHESPLWIQTIHLDKGAFVNSYQHVISYNAQTGEPQFQKTSISEVISSLPHHPAIIINGQFFNPKTQPSELSFWLKSNGIIRSAGADNRKEKKNILHINNHIAEIIPYSWKSLNNTQWDFAIVNLTLDNPKYKNEQIGRTYICLPYPNKENQSSTLLIFIAQTMTEPRIEKEIFSHGCTKKSTSKLDSSGSTRLYFGWNFIFWNNHKWDADKRKIPNHILFFDVK